MRQHDRTAPLLLLLLTATVGCSDGVPRCYPVTQVELDAALVNDRCREIHVLDFDEERLDASSDRDDIELFINPGYCVTFDQCQAVDPVLKTAHVDNIRVSAVNLESVVVTRYQGGSVRVPSIDMTLDEAPTFGLSSAGFTVLDGGSVRLRATAPMDGWRHMRAAALPSWEGVTVEVDPAAQPTTVLALVGDGLNLVQLQQFGSKAQEIKATALSAEVLEAYASWLEAEEFAGSLTIGGPDDEPTVILPRSTTP